jgi:hypothetical protein
MQHAKTYLKVVWLYVPPLTYDALSWAQVPEDNDARRIRPHLHNPRYTTDTSSIHWPLTGYILHYTPSVF